MMEKAVKNIKIHSAIVIVFFSLFSPSF